MTTQSHTESIDYYKKSASLLLKELNCKDTSRVALALSRLQVLQRSRLEVPSKVQRKHALAVVALEAGYTSWLDLRQQLERKHGLDFSEYFGLPRFGGFINHWFSDYEEARTFHSQHGGVLLPYRRQCFVTSLDFLAALGMEQDDSDWLAIAYDWVKPGSPDAHSRLQQRLQLLERLRE